ncbi:MAG: winged helix-turn-helix domain-containing protein [Holophagales bacterium]|nr:winged helix-turn-helix domain-containing protein [Holophagales bacterium]
MRGSEAGEVVRFGSFEFDSERLELRRYGQALTLQPQPTRALALLLSRPGRLVEREELQAELWGRDPQLDVDRSLNHTIRKLRQVLDDDAQRSTYIQTVPRRGYRFIAEISSRSLRERGSETATAPAQAHRPERASADSTSGGGDGDGFGAMGGAVSELPVGRRGGPIRIAVHDFRDVSADHRWPRLSDGVVEELISELVSMRPAGLSVLDTPAAPGVELLEPEPGRSASPPIPGHGTSARSSPSTAPPGGTGGGRDFGIRGCVRRSGCQVRLNVHLIRALDGTLVGTARLDDELGDLFEVQRRMARQIAEMLVLPLLDTGGFRARESSSETPAGRSPIRGAGGARNAPPDGPAEIG